MKFHILSFTILSKELESGFMTSLPSDSTKYSSRVTSSTNFCLSNTNLLPFLVAALRVSPSYSSPKNFRGFSHSPLRLTHPVLPKLKYILAVTIPLLGVISGTSMSP